MSIINIGNTVHVEFRYGEVSVSSGLLKTDNVVGVLAFSEYTPDNEGIIRELTPDEVPVRIAFECIEHVDDVIRALEHVKQCMNNGTVE